MSTAAILERPVRRATPAPPRRRAPGYRVMLRSPAFIDEKTGLADWSIDRALQRHVRECLLYTNGNRKWAASELGVNISTLWRWLDRWEGEGAAQPRRQA